MGGTVADAEDENVVDANVVEVVGVADDRVGPAVAVVPEVVPVGVPVDDVTVDDDVTVGVGV